MGRFRNRWIFSFAFILNFWSTDLKKKTKFIFLTVSKMLLLGCRYWNPQVEEFNGVIHEKILRDFRLPHITIWEPLLCLTLDYTDRDQRELRLVWIIVWNLNIKLAEKSPYFSCWCTCYWINWTLLSSIIQTSSSLQEY